MATEKIKINGAEIKQPDENMAYNFESTYSEDSTRVQSGEGHFTPIFTVESLGYVCTKMTDRELTQILQAVIGKQFTLHYYSPYYGSWRDDTFYVGQGSLNIKKLDGGSAIYNAVSFNMIGVNPIPIN